MLARRFLLLSLLSIFLAQSPFAMTIASCQNISYPGEYVSGQDLAAADLNFSDGAIEHACIVISSENVTFSCGGFNITNNGTLYAAGIVVNSSASIPHANVTVENCPGISGYAKAVYLYNASGVTVRNVTSQDNDAAVVLCDSSNNTIYNNTAYGIWAFQIEPYSDYNNFTDNTVYGSTVGFECDTSSYNNFANNTVEAGTYGFSLSYCSNGTIANNSVVGGSPDWGIRLSYSDYNSISDNYAKGIALASSSHNNLTGNVACDHTMGIYVYSSSSSNLIRNNTVCNNSAAGFGMIVATGNTYLDNVAHGNSANGFLIRMGTGNEFRNNTVYDQPQHGFYVYVTSHSNNFTGNWVCDNGNSGFYVSGSNYNSFTANTMCNNSYGLYTSASSGTNVTNCTIYGNLYGFYARGSGSHLLKTTSFLGAGGAFEDYVNLSIEDVQGSPEQYSVNWSAPPGSSPTGTGSFENKFANISVHSGSPSIDRVSWFWDDSELQGRAETGLELWAYDGSSWSLLNSTPDVSSDTLDIYALNPASIYGIFAPGGGSSSSSGSGAEDYECFTSSDCPDCYWCRGHECMLNPNDPGACASAGDCSGDYPFYSCLSCTCRGYWCNADGDCDEGYSCLDERCVPPECFTDSDCESTCAGCTCEEYACVLPECLTDADCARGESCRDHACILAGCSLDSDCAEGFECVVGSCERKPEPAEPHEAEAPPAGNATGSAEVPMHANATGYDLLPGGSSPPSGLLPGLSSWEGAYELLLLLLLLALAGASYLLHTRKPGRPWRK